MKTFHFIDSRHGYIYIVKGAKNLKEALEKVKKRTAGKIWYDPFEDPDFSYYVTKADKVIEIK